MTPVEKDIKLYKIANVFYIFIILNPFCIRIYFWVVHGYYYRWKWDTFTIMLPIIYIILIAINYRKIQRLKRQKMVDDFLND